MFKVIANIIATLFVMLLAIGAAILFNPLVWIAGILFYALVLK